MLRSLILPYSLKPSSTKCLPDRAIEDVNHQVAVAIHQTELDFTKLAAMTHQHARTPSTPMEGAAARATTSEDKRRGAGAGGEGGKGEGEDKNGNGETGTLLAHVSSSNYFSKDLVAILKDLHDTQTQHEEDNSRNMHKTAAPTMAVPRNAFESGDTISHAERQWSIWTCSPSLCYP